MYDDNSGLKLYTKILKMICKDTDIFGDEQVHRILKYFIPVANIKKMKTVSSPARDPGYNDIFERMSHDQLNKEYYL